MWNPIYLQSRSSKRESGHQVLSGNYPLVISKLWHHFMQFYIFTYNKNPM